MSDLIWYIRLHDRDLKSQKFSSLAFASSIIILTLLLLLLLLVSYSLFHKVFAASPRFFFFQSENCYFSFLAERRVIYSVSKIRYALIENIH